MIVDDRNMTRYSPEWTKAINEDDIIGMVKWIIICHTSTGKASKCTNKFIATLLLQGDNIHCRVCQPTVPNS